MAIHRRLLALIGAAALAVGGCAQDDSEAKEQSAGFAGGTSTLRASLAFERTLASDAAGDPGAGLAARVAGPGVTSARLRTPLGEEIDLPASAGGGEAAAVVPAASDEGLLERFPQGAYALDVTLDDGGRRSLTIVVRGGFPPFPEIVDPADGETGVGALPVVTFQGYARRHDVSVVALASGERAVLTDDSDLLAATPGAPLASGAAYRLEVRAESGPLSHSFTFVSTRTSRFETAP